MSVGGVWEFIKGLTARVICLEDALNLKNMEIETLNQRLTQLGLVVNEITKGIQNNILSKKLSLKRHPLTHILKHRV